MRHLLSAATAILTLSTAPVGAEQTEALGTWCNQNDLVPSWDAIVTLWQDPAGALQVEYQFQGSRAAFDLVEEAPGVFLQRDSENGDGVAVAADGMLIIFDDLGPISEAFPFADGMTCYR